MVGQGEKTRHRRQGGLEAAKEPKTLGPGGYKGASFFLVNFIDV